MNLTQYQLKHIINEELQKLFNESRITPNPDEMIKATDEIGFTNVEFISSGQYGSVFKGSWRYDGLERAIKVLSNDVHAQKEARIYRMISDARRDSPLIAKHFPRVDMIRKTSDGKHVIIVMELLESDPNVKAVIEDLFGYREVGAFRPDVSLQDLDVFKDIGYRANMMVVEPKSRLILINHMAYSFPNEVRDELRKVVLAMNFDNMIYPQEKFNKLKARMSQKSPALWDYMDVAEEDLAKSGVAAMSFLFYFLAYSIKLLQEYPQKITLNDILSELEFSVEHFIESYRNYTPIGMGGPNYPGAPKETEGLSYPGAKSLLAAIEEVKNKVGIDAYDMHDRNVLVRPGTKDIVIVDVGLFREDHTKPTKYGTDVTNIQEKASKRRNK